MTVVFVCKTIHLKDDLFRATQLDHRFSEELVADESVVDVVIFLFATPLLKLICRVVLFTSRCFPIPVTVWPALPDVEVRDREEIQHGRHVLLVFSCIIFQEVTARAIDDADVLERQTYFAL